MKTAVVIPTGPGRSENLRLVIRQLSKQTVAPALIVVVRDGHYEDVHVDPGDEPKVVIVTPDTKFVPSAGMDQPRNIGVRAARHMVPDLTHVAFLDSDVIVKEDWLEQIERAYGSNGSRVMACPYEWLPGGLRPETSPHFWHSIEHVDNDQRRAMFDTSPPIKVYLNDLSAGLACWSGNLVWPIAEFERVGGFWNEIHHGRCEDGELGLRAVAMGVGISFCAAARGFHLDHPVNMAWKLSANERDVPMLNARHPWVQNGGVFLVDRDGKAFDVKCPGCSEVVSTGVWWDHARECPHHQMDLPVAT